MNYDESEGTLFGAKVRMYCDEGWVSLVFNSMSMALNAVCCASLITVMSSWSWHVYPKLRTQDDSSSHWSTPIKHWATPITLCYTHHAELHPSCWATPITLSYTHHTQLHPSHWSTPITLSSSPHIKHVSLLTFQGFYWRAPATDIAMQQAGVAEPSVKVNSFGWANRWCHVLWCHIQDGFVVVSQN